MSPWDSRWDGGPGKDLSTAEAARFEGGCNRSACSAVITVVRVPRGGLDDRRFDDFFVFDYARLVGSLRLVTGDADRARDAVDEACARACERLARGRPIDVLGAWIRVVAFNVARDRLRKRRSERLARDRLAQQLTYTDGDLSVHVARAIDVSAALARLQRRRARDCRVVLLLGPAGRDNRARPRHLGRNRQVSTTSRSDHACRAPE